MKVLVLGADGMLGHKMLQVLSISNLVYGAVRNKTPLTLLTNQFKSVTILDEIDATCFDSISKAIETVNPKVIINCIGIIKQRVEAMSAVDSIKINSLFPHLLANYCIAKEIRLIHFSTDCVFSGQKGSYTEADIPDPVDLYGRSKLLGELDSPGTLTLRTSIIGWELKNKTSLLEWFAAQRGKTIQGYCNAIYSGISTKVLAELTNFMIEKHPHLYGIYHVSSTSISKHDLLCKLKTALQWSDIGIKADYSNNIDRSLNSNKFSSITGWVAPTWDAMVADLAMERALYEQWR